MVTIEWCKDKGIKLIDPNDNLAEESLRLALITSSSSSNMWLATQKYYAKYLATYTILMKIGIKTEKYILAQLK